MIKGVIAGLIFVVMSVGGYVLYVFYQKMQNSEIHVEQPVAKIPKKESIVNIPKMENVQNEAWINNANEKIASTNYQFPSNVLDINVEVKRYEDLQMDYTKVVIKNLDDYKFFCLNEILRQKHIDFSYFKNNNSLDLLLFVPDEKIRDIVLQDFRYYGIEYEVGIKR